MSNSIFTVLALTFFFTFPVQTDTANKEQPRTKGQVFPNHI